MDKKTRDAKIIKLHKEGVSRDALAERFGIMPGYVVAIIKTYKDKERKK
jgi:transposase